MPEMTVCIKTVLPGASQLCAVICLLSLCACTTIPSRFTIQESLGRDLGYSIENETAMGFDLEIFYYEYSFLPEPDAAIVSARDRFARTATHLASERDRRIKPIKKTLLNTEATRNIIDGNYVVYVRGRIEYGPRSVEAVPSAPAVKRAPASQVVSGGTCFVVNPDGNVLTSHHVVKGANRIIVHLSAGDVGTNHEDVAAQDSWRFRGYRF